MLIRKRFDDKVEGVIVELTSTGYECRTYRKNGDNYYEDADARKISHELDSELAMAKTQREKKELLQALYPEAQYVSENCFYVI